MNKIYQKTLPAGKNAGFTLIDLLVVVLIIGILAAIALPQYNKAVMKSKLMKRLPILKALKHGRDLFLLDGGAASCVNLEAFAIFAGINYKDYVLQGKNACEDSRLTVPPDWEVRSAGGGIFLMGDNDFPQLFLPIQAGTLKGLNAEVGDVFCKGGNERLDTLCRYLTTEPKQIHATVPIYKIPWAVVR